MSNAIWTGCFLPVCGYLDESHAHHRGHPSHQQGHLSLVVPLECQTSISMATSPHPPGTWKPTCRSLSALTAKNAILWRERGNRKALSDFFFLLKGVISTKAAESLVPNPEYFIHHALQGATDKEKGNTSICGPEKVINEQKALQQTPGLFLKRPCLQPRCQEYRLAYHRHAKITAYPIPFLLSFWWHKLLFYSEMQCISPLLKKSSMKFWRHSL